MAGSGGASATDVKSVAQALARRRKRRRRRMQKAQEKLTPADRPGTPY